MRKLGLSFFSVAMLLAWVTSGTARGCLPVDLEKDPANPYAHWTFPAHGRTDGLSADPRAIRLSKRAARELAEAGIEISDLEHELGSARAIRIGYDQFPASDFVILIWHHGKPFQLFCTHDPKSGVALLDSLHEVDKRAATECPSTSRTNEWRAGVLRAVDAGFPPIRINLERTHFRADPHGPEAHVRTVTTSSNSLPQLAAWKFTVDSVQRALETWTCTDVTSHGTALMFTIRGEYRDHEVVFKLHTFPGEARQRGLAYLDEVKFAVYKQERNFSLPPVGPVFSVVRFETNEDATRDLFRIGVSGVEYRQALREAVLLEAAPSEQPDTRLLTAHAVGTRHRLTLQMILNGDRVARVFRVSHSQD